MLPVPRTNVDEPETTIGGDLSLDGSEAEATVEVPSAPYYFDDLKDFGWFSIGASIVLAGGAYPIVLAVGAIFVMMLLEGPPSRIDVMEVFGVSLMFAVVAGVTGIIWATIVSTLTLPVLHLVLWSMKLRLNLVKLGAFAGGLVGFIAVLPAAVGISASLGTGAASQSILGLLVGPGVATILGQLGGARGGRRAEWRVEAKMASRRALAKIGRLRPRRMGELRDDDASGEFDDGIDMPRFRFRTIHLLWLGVWMSLLLTVIRLSRFPFELILPILLVWFAYQATTLALGSWLLPQVAAAWRAGRQNRST